MQLVIEISDGLYNNLDTIKNGSIASKIILDCVRKGKVLPKGHGRLIDADKLLKTWYDDFCYDDFCEFMSRAELNSMNNVIKNAPTIIEADKN